MVTFLDAPEENLTFDEFHEARANEWIFPVVYQQIDVLFPCVADDFQEFAVAVNQLQAGLIALRFFDAQ